MLYKHSVYAYHIKLNTVSVKIASDYTETMFNFICPLLKLRISITIDIGS